MSMGAAGSGTDFHTHAASWFVLVDGVKEWLLVPPDEDPLTLEPLRIVQRAGDKGLYIPPVSLADISLIQ